MQQLTARRAVVLSLALFSRRDRRRLAVAALLGMAASMLDIVGVLLLGLVAAYGAATLSHSSPPSTLVRAAGALGWHGTSAQSLLTGAASAAAGFLLVKSAIALYVNKRILVFLANRQTELSERLATAVLSRPLLEIQSRSSQATTYALTDGITIATLAMLSSAVVGLSEGALLVSLGATLFFVDPVVTGAAFVFFGAIVVLMQFVLGRRIARAGEVAAEAAVRSRVLLQDALGTFREILVLDRRSYYATEITNSRRKNAFAVAESNYVNLMPKYVLEAAMVIGAMGLAGGLLATEETSKALGTVTLFLAAATRVLPSILRLQQATLNLRNAAGGALPLYHLVDDLREQGALRDSSTGLTLPPVISPPGQFCGDIQVENVSVTYPGSATPALDRVTFSVGQGDHVALVGPSGSGKSTLADVIMGALTPDRGRVAIGGLSPLGAIAAWPGAVSYVPQRVYLTDASVRENVALGMPSDAIDDAAVWEALRRVELGDFVSSLPNGLSATVGEGGVRWSGGQRQRLGMARALYTRPRVLLLDEATSSLDAETEFAITETLTRLKGDVTILVIAHRLSTVIRCDSVMYLGDGRLLATGSFEEVRSAVPSLERQAQLSGL